MAAEVARGTLPSAEDLLRCTDDELRGYLQSRDHLVAKALQEVEELEVAPRYFAERLNRLESYFKDLRPGDTVRLVDPQLKLETEAIKEQLRLEERRNYMDRPHLDHEEDHSSGRFFSSADRVVAHADHEDFVLGKGYLPIDRNALHYKRATGERRQNYHPTIDAVHYAGNLEAHTETVQPMWVLPGGHLERRPLEIPDPSSTFWLERPRVPPPSFAGISGDRPLFGQGAVSNTDVPVPPSARPAMGEGGAARAEDPLGKATPMHQEPMPVDWLGLARRGIPPEGLGEAP